MNHEFTSDEIASFASCGLRLGKDSLTDAQFRSVSGSVLTQARPWTLVPLFADHEFSGEEVASFASYGVRFGKDSLTDQQFRAVCGSALAQARPHESRAPGAPAHYNNLMWSGYPLPQRNALMDAAEAPPNMLAKFLQREGR